MRVSQPYRLLLMTRWRVQHARSFLWADERQRMKQSAQALQGEGTWLPESSSPLQLEAQWEHARLSCPAVCAWAGHQHPCPA